MTIKLSSSTKLRTSGAGDSQPRVIIDIKEHRISTIVIPHDSNIVVISITHGDSSYITWRCI